MFNQKLYKNGNSIAVTIPKEYLKELNLRDGTQVVVDQRGEELIVTSKKKNKDLKSSVDPKFLKWLDSFNKEYGPALKELANR